LAASPPLGPWLELGSFSRLFDESFDGLFGAPGCWASLSGLPCGFSCAAPLGLPPDCACWSSGCCFELSPAWFCGSFPPLPLESGRCESSDFCELSAAGFC